jgi:hypothetical protein
MIRLTVRNSELCRCHIEFAGLYLPHINKKIPISYQVGRMNLLLGVTGSVSTIKLIELIATMERKAKDNLKSSLNVCCKIVHSSFLIETMNFLFTPIYRYRL